MKQQCRLATRTALMLGAIALCSVLPNNAAAAPKMHCVGEPFSFTEIETTQFTLERRGVSLEWQARGMTTLECAGSAVLGIDVWEHAYSVTMVSVGPDAGAIGVSLRGRTENRVIVPDGGTVLLGGIIAGNGTCGSGVCTVDAEVKANRPGGAKLRMLQRMTMELATGTITAIEVLSIVIEFTGAG